MKRISLRHAVEFVHAELGDEKFQSLCESLSPEDREIVESRSGLPTDLVPVSVMDHLVAAGAQALGEKVEQFARRVGRVAGHAIGQTPYKHLIVTKDPMSVLSKAPMMWKLIYDRGEVTVKQRGAGAASLFLSSFPAEPAVCARLTGLVHGYLDVVGREGEVAHVRCRTRGDADCEWQIEWKAS